MKARIGFVSNSSSCSFIVSYRKGDKAAKVLVSMLNGEESALRIKTCDELLKDADDIITEVKSEFGDDADISSWMDWKKELMKKREDAAEKGREIIEITVPYEAVSYIKPVLEKLVNDGTFTIIEDYDYFFG